MKIYQLLVLFCLSYVTVFGQTTIYDDDFNNDKNKWATTAGELPCTLKKGELFIKNKSKVNLLWTLQTLDFNPDDKDFDIETSFRITTSSSTLTATGLVWSGYTDDSYYNVVRFSPNKKYQIYQHQNGKYLTQTDWTFENSLNSIKKNNVILIQKRANIINVFLNKKLVLQSGENSYFGNKVGFILDPKMTIAVDYLRVIAFDKNIQITDSFDPNLKINPLSEAINTIDYDETNPVISADGSILYFDRKNSPENVGDENKDDVWISTKNDKNEWNQAKNMGAPLNNEGHNFVISSSPDNNTLLLGNTYGTDGTPYGAGVSISNKTINGWHIPYIMDIKAYENKNQYVSYFLTNDNKFLLLAVETSSGYGKKDLYVCTKSGEYAWSSPVNLGKTINTFDDEANPFLAADGKTMYFASLGHPGFGMYDLFVTKRLDDTWTNWSEPENLGNVINSTAAELSIFLTAKGDNAYISKGGDIWEVFNTVKQDPVVLIKGQVFDAKTKQIMSSEIVYNDLKTNKEIGTAISDPLTGKFSIVLPFGSIYSFMAEKEGYYAVTENVNVADLKEYKELTVDLYLKPIEKGQTIRLNNIFFESGKFTLLPESFAELDKLFDVLQENSKIEIKIAGHTDAIGTDQTNLVLSINRAKAVMTYLIEKGINAERLSSEGFGETKFITENETEVGRQKNRRVEFSILEM